MLHSHTCHGCLCICSIKTRYNQWHHRLRCCDLQISRIWIIWWLICRTVRRAKGNLCCWCHQIWNHINDFNWTGTWNLICQSLGIQNSNQLGQVNKHLGQYIQYISDAYFPLAGVNSAKSGTHFQQPHGAFRRTKCCGSNPIFDFMDAQHVFRSYILCHYVHIQWHVARVGNFSY